MQYIIIALSALAIGHVFLRYHLREISHGMMALWMLIWSAVFLFALFPGQTSVIAKFAGIGRGVDLAIYVAILLLFYLIFRLYTKIDVLDRHLTKLVREIAQKDAHQTKRDQSKENCR